MGFCAARASWTIAVNPETACSRESAMRTPITLRLTTFGALAALTGEWHGYDARAWQEWWERSGLALQ